jgi:Right handed beta helix region
VRAPTLAAVAQGPPSPLVASLAVALALLSACGGGSAAQAPELYVDRDSVGGGCSDDRPRGEVSESSPWCSLDRAIEAAPAGSTVLVRRGTYPGLMVDAERRDRIVTLKGAPGERPAVDGIELKDAGGFRFEGFRITNDNRIHDEARNVQFVRNEMRDGTMAVGDVGGILFARNHVHDVPLNVDNPAGSVGLWAGGEPAPSGITVRGNRFERLPNDALFLSARDLLVENNRFINIQSPDNDIAHADVLQCMGCTNLVYRGNYARDNDSGLLNSVADSENWLIENNVFLRSESWPLQLDNENRDLILRNNTFWDSGVGVLFRWDPAFDANPSGFVITNNIFDNLSIDGRLNIAVEDHNLIAGGQRDAGPNSLVRARPRFMDVEAGDMRLAPGSPGIDAGTGAHAAATDILGGARPVDDPDVRNRGAGAFDIGAHERGSRPGRGRAPLLTLRVPTPQRLRRGRLVVYATCTRDCTVKGRARVGARRVATRPARRRMAAGRWGRLVLRFRPAGRRALRDALGQRRSLRGVVTVTVRSGGDRSTATRRVRVRR